MVTGRGDVTTVDGVLFAALLTLNKTSLTLRGGSVLAFRATSMGRTGPPPMLRELMAGAQFIGGPGRRVGCQLTVSAFRVPLPLGDFDAMLAQRTETKRATTLWCISCNF